jgi:hypothetical protein
METRIKRAIRNNAQWCQLVCRAHGRPGEFFDEIWINRAPLPRFYPNAQTLAEWGSRQINLIRELTNQGLPSGWAVKDSFASLDLSTCGFIPLFDAQWLYLSQERLRAVSSASAPRVRWESVRADRVLAEWERAWCEAHQDTSPERVYLPALLEDRDVAILAARRADHIVGGAIGNRSDGVIGWSNLFVKQVRDLRDLAAGSLLMLSKIFPGLPLVGYEGGDALRGALLSGFEAIGPLRVWIFGALHSLE